MDKSIKQSHDNKNEITEIKITEKQVNEKEVNTNRSQEYEIPDEEIMPL